MTNHQQEDPVSLSSTNEFNSSSGEDSTSDSSSSSSSEEEEEEEDLMITKPIYMSKTTRNKEGSLNNQITNTNEEKGQLEEKNGDNSSEHTNRKKQITISKLDHQVIQDTSDNKLEFDGVDDTDDIDPELEYENWKIRELNRFKRDQDIIKQIELEKEDQLRRNN